jgi:uncharacterized protein YecE (DUF72 family)
MLPYQRVTPAVRIGCSGWQYKHWRGGFYPSALPVSRWLEHYARHFDTVEINNSFYRLPTASTFASWRRKVPAGFIYAVKASRFLTHMKKLKDPHEPLALFFSRAKHLGRALGPVLYQLPPRWPLNLERLETFLRDLPRTRQHAIEFRDPTWYDERALALLERHKVTLCLHDMEGSASGRLSIGPFTYVRFHGPSKYSGSYPDRVLAEWAAWLSDRIVDGKPVFAYFNNDTGGHAPRDAVRLREFVERRLKQHVVSASAEPTRRSVRLSPDGRDVVKAL